MVARSGLRTNVAHSQVRTEIATCGGGDGAVAAQHLGRALGSNSMQGGEQPVDVKPNALDTQTAPVLCNSIDGPGKA